MAVEGPLDASRLHAAVRGVVARHEILRTSFHEAPDSTPPVQVVHPAPELDWVYVDDVARAASSGAVLDTAWREEAGRPHDPRRLPALRVSLRKVAPDQHVMVLGLPALCADARTLDNVISEISEGYAGATPPADVVQYAQYAGWQQEHLAGEKPPDAARFLLRERSLPRGPLRLPQERYRGEPSACVSEEARHLLYPGLAGGLDELARDAGSTTSTLVLACWQALLARLSGQDEIVVDVVVDARELDELTSVMGLFSRILPFHTRLRAGGALPAAVRAIDGRAREVGEWVSYVVPPEEASASPRIGYEYVDRTPRRYADGVVFALRRQHVDLEPFRLKLSVLRTALSMHLCLEYDGHRFSGEAARGILGQLVALLGGFVSAPGRPIRELPLLPHAEQARQSEIRRGPPLEYDRDRTIHGLFEAQAAAGPDRTALVCRQERISYAALDRRADELGCLLRSIGVGAESVVGLCVERSMDMVAALLGILKAGGACLYLDPQWPARRTSFVLGDADARVLLTTWRLKGRFDGPDSRIVCLDAVAPPIRAGAGPAPEPVEGSEHLAYVIYTSGSTADPKGVMVSHRNVVSFFRAMDEHVPHEPPGVWLAVTSLAFDISVLELLWTLTRGFKVVLSTDSGPVPRRERRVPWTARVPEFSLFYFASDDTAAREASFRLLMDGARFADRNGFAAVWTPERHFHPFGGLFPNAAVTSSAIAAVTERIRIRAGSCVLPLHSPVRVAEEWAFVDNLSGGRVGVSFASGWHPRDFALAAGSYEDRRAVLREQMETVRALWRGEAVLLEDGNGEQIEVRTFPRPVQPELPVWLTAARSPETFRTAGQMGVNVLTHLLGQSLTELTDKIALYREAWRRAAHAGSGCVTLMVHTFVGEDESEVMSLVREPMLEYLRGSAGLMQSALTPDELETVEALTPEDREELLRHAFERYFETSGLFGTVDSCLSKVDEIAALGVDEIGCLIDFGVEPTTVLEHLPHLGRLKQTLESRTAAVPVAHGEEHESIAMLVERYGVTHMQCTPSLATLLMASQEGQAAIGSLKHFFVGGETLNPRLAQRLLRHVPGTLMNMYGPTETTVWSSTHPVRSVAESIPLGRPIANTQVYDLDERGRIQPMGTPGELYIGGDGVARGYLRRPGLTGERFVPCPFGSAPGARLYKSGDLGTYATDGNLRFLGRIDNQLKIRGVRVEPEEIEAQLTHHRSVRSAAVIPVEAADGEKRLAGYVEPRARVLTEDDVFLLPNGMPVARLSDFHLAGMYTEVFVDNTYLRHGITVEDGDCVLDVGANIGLFSLFVSQVAHGLRIYAFEPVGPIFDVLRANIDLYGLDVTCLEHGLSDQAGDAAFTFYPHAPGLSSYARATRANKDVIHAMAREWLARSGTEGERSMLDPEQVDRPLDDYLQSVRHVCHLEPLSEFLRGEGIERVDLLKVDVEGAEVDVLHGIGDEHWAGIGQIVMEIHSRRDLQQVEAILRRRGYEILFDETLDVEPRTGEPGAFVGTLYAVQAPRSLTRRDGAALPRRRRLAPQHPVLSRDELKSFLERRLPHGMVPSELHFIDKLPRTYNGKLDRRTLAATAPRGGGRRGRFEGPRNALEARLIRIWAEVLGHRRLGVDDSFFELGGDSLLVVQMVSKVSEEFGVEMTLQQVFAGPKIAAMAQTLESLGCPRRDERPGRAAIPRVARHESLPLSFAQQRLWFLEHLHRAGPFYNAPLVFRLRGNLVLPALEQSLAEVVRRHEVLRTTFDQVDGRPVQVIREGLPLAFRMIDLSGRCAAQGRRLVVEEARRPFDLRRGPLLRVCLVRLERREHLLVVNMHHIVSDGGSIPILIDEMTSLYRRFLAGETSDLPELPIQYADYAVWHRRRMEGDELAEQMEYWTSYLAELPILELPADFPRPAVQSYRGATRWTAVPGELTESLRRLARRNDATLYMVVLAVFKVLLWRLTGQADVAVGTPIANRTPEIRHLIGAVANTLVLRTHISAAAGFEELLAHVRRVCLDAYARGEVPFEMLVEELQPERTRSRSPLFQVMFILQNAPLEGFELPGLTASQLGVDKATSLFDWTLSLGVASTGLSGTFEYSTDLFTATTVQRVLRSLELLLRGVVEDPGRPVGEAPLLAACELHQIRVEWNDTETDPPAAAVHELAERQAGRTPDAAAVVFGGAHLTYGGLDHRANHLAHRLREMDVQPGDVVGLYLERSVEAAVAVLATFKAAAACLPLNPSHPPERLAWMLRDARAAVLLTDSATAPGLPAHPARELLVDRRGETAGTGRHDDPRIASAPEAPAYLIYTSGSTGEPKGVSFPHRALANLIFWHGRALRRGARTLQFASLSFDASFHEMFAAWSTGGRLIVVPEAARTDAGSLARRLVDEGVEKTILPAVILHELAQSLLAHSVGPERLTEVITTGEQLLVTQPVRDAFCRLGGCRLHNHYGPSETHVVTSYTAQGNPCRWPARPPIGRPISNTQVHVLDPRGRTLPIGPVGDLYVGGSSVAGGYAGRPRLTAEVFLADTLSSSPGARWYLTGDLARRLPDGHVDFLGRRDHQVKVRGFRVEPGEVESVLESHGMVSHAVVVPRETGRASIELAAYVVPRTGYAPTAGELSAFLTRELPAYMLPGTYTLLDSLPLTRHGKVDRRALPEPSEVRPELAEAFVAPQNPLERQVAEIWKEEVRATRVGIHDNFFALGGHSLMAMRIVSRLRDAFDVDIPVQQIFATPTVAGVAAYVESAASGDGLWAAHRSHDDREEFEI